jgi:membrane protein DedA with SNARE-associated domain
MTGFLEDYGLLILFLVIALQASGVPGPPGKTALVVAALLAARGRFELWQVLVVASIAGIVGGYSGYVAGRTGGRRLLEWQWITRRFERPFELAREFFDRHGEKAVFLARFFPGLKVVAAVAAGSFGMRWWPFAIWHALGSIAFALVFGLTAYFAGEAAIELIERFGALAAVALAVLALLGYLGFRYFRRGRRIRSRPRRSFAQPSSPSRGR